MNISVLLVDDHKVLRMGLKLLIDAEVDMQVVGKAGDGLSALQQARDLQPDVIVMDITMPDMDGIEATAKIKSEFPHIKLVAFSIHDDRGYIERVLSAGAGGYVLKERAPDDLVAGIRAVQRGELYLSEPVKDIVLSRYVDTLAGIPAVGDEAAFPSLLTTKLHRPSIAPQTVERSRLLQQLEAGLDRPLTLVSAPAGYGKSILVSQWLEICGCSSAWLSLDARDNDLRLFVTYLGAAVQTQFPGAMQEIAPLLKTPNSPPLNTLVYALVNDLERISEPFILALDDYHVIVDGGIHELIGEILRHPPQHLHLVLITRTDPALDLLHMRAYQQIGELRARELSFTVEETAAFLQGMVGMRVEERIARQMMARTEGWVTGLHLITLTANDITELDNLSTALSGERQTMDFLASEALSHQPPGIQEWLLKSSILDRFCASLCDAVCASPGNEKAAQLSGDEFISWLTESNLFVITLDYQEQWFRYHHLFQRLLQNQLSKALVPEELASLHLRASRWFADNHLIEEAVEHALAAGDVVAAAEIVEKHRHSELEAGRWHTSERWLAMLPERIKQERPALMLGEAWIAFTRFQLAKTPPMIAQIEAVVDEQSADPKLLGELNFFRGNLLYWSGEPEASIQYLEEALSQISVKWKHIDGNIEVMLGVARHMCGREEFAIAALTDRIRTTDPGEIYLRSYLHSALLILYALSGSLAQAAAELLLLQRVNRKLRNPSNQAWAFYLQGCVKLNAFNLEDAASSLEFASQQRYSLDTVAVIDALVGLSLTRQLMGQVDEAAIVMEGLLKFAQEFDESLYLSMARSGQARLALLQGDLPLAAHWAQEDREPPAAAELFLWLEVPALTQARVLIAVGSAESLGKAAELLQQIRERSENYFFAGQTIEAAVLQSVTLAKQGRAKEARNVLLEALALAQPGSWIRPFVEAGAPMARLLRELQNQGAATEFGNQVDLILAAFPLPAAVVTEPEIIDPLTDREMEVLQLLDTVLSAREIAEQLVVSINTVRMHTKSIYSKLDVHRRIEAVERARELGLIL